MTLLRPGFVVFHTLSRVLSYPVVALDLCWSFRRQILLREGGLYVDVDFVCFGSFDELHRTRDFYAGLSNTGTFELNNALIG